MTKKYPGEIIKILREMKGWSQNRLAVEAVRGMLMEGKTIRESSETRKDRKNAKQNV